MTLAFVEAEKSTKNVACSSQNVKHTDKSNIFRKIY